MPEILAFLFSMLVLLVGVFVPRASGLTTGLAAFGALATFVATVVLLVVRFEGSFFGDAYVVDDFALYFKLIVALSAFFTVLAASRWSGQTGDAPEYLTLILSVAVGAMLLVSMRDLFGIFVAIELATIPSYALVAFDRTRRESAEGGMKYLLTGMIAASILLYGIVLIYGVSGSANLAEISRTYTESPSLALSCSSQALPSRSPRHLSTFGPRTLTRAPRRAPRRSFPWPRRLLPSLCCSASSSRACPTPQPRGRRWRRF
jgi:NADH-quinone oxidoreductase subunit N